mmetsp:Transcript_21359/g.53018  ORF Transcript_21359/g.53018 Transcript_21359/m.53018 type:complete len:263 (+) Transcript_21359:476-1264(+)
MVLAENRVLHVEHGECIYDEPSQRDVRVERAVRVRRGKREQTLAEVHEPLRDSHKEEKRRVLVVVAGQLAELACEPSVVRPRADDAEGEAGGLSDLLVAVVAQPPEQVSHAELRVGDVQQRESHRASLSNRGIAVPNQMVVRTHRHVRAELFGRTNKRNAQGGNRLRIRNPLTGGCGFPVAVTTGRSPTTLSPATVGVVLFLSTFQIWMLSAAREQRLNLEHVATARVCANLEGHLEEFADARAQCLGNLKRRLNFALTLKE